MELRSLAYFVRIAELGSITRAAGASASGAAGLDPGMSSGSKTSWACRLLTRANRGVKLTEAGQNCSISAARILREVERTGDEIRVAGRPS